MFLPYCTDQHDQKQNILKIKGLISNSKQMLKVNFYEIHAGCNKQSILLEIKYLRCMFLN